MRIFLPLITPKNQTKREQWFMMKQRKDLNNPSFNPLLKEICTDQLSVGDIPLIVEYFRLLISGKSNFKIKIYGSDYPDPLMLESLNKNNLKSTQAKKEWTLNSVIFIALQLALESENVAINIFEWLEALSYLKVYYDYNYQLAIKNFILSPPDFDINVKSDIINLIRLNCLCILNYQKKAPAELNLDKNLRKNFAEKIEARNLLHLAISRETKSIFEVLFELIDQRPKQLLDKKNNTLLHLCDDEEYLEEILPFTSSINAQNIDGDTALHCAIRMTKLEKIIFLISHGAKVDIININKEKAVDLLEDNFCLLLFEAFSTHNIKFIDFLREFFKEKKVNFYDATNNSFLHLVEDEKFFKYALELTGNINHQNNDGDTPLLVVVRNKQIEKKLFLINNGADFFIKNKYGESPIDLMSDDSRYNHFNTNGKVLSPAPKSFRQVGYTCGIYAVKTSADYHYGIAPSLFNQPIPPARKNDVNPKSANSIHQLAKALNITHAGPIFEIDALAKLIEKVGCTPFICEPKNYEEFMECIIKAIDLNLPIIIPCSHDGKKIALQANTPHLITIIGYCNKTSTNILIVSSGNFESINAKDLYYSFSRGRNTTYAPFSLTKNGKEWGRTTLTSEEINILSARGVLKGKGFFHQLQEVPLNNFYGRLIIVAPPNYDLTLLNDVELNHKNNI